MSEGAKLVALDVSDGPQGHHRYVAAHELDAQSAPIDVVLGRVCRRTLASSGLERFEPDRFEEGRQETRGPIADAGQHEGRRGGDPRLSRAVSRARAIH